MKMKHVIAMVGVILMSFTSLSFAAAHEGDCVYPKTKSIAGNRLGFDHSIYLYNEPSASASKQLLTTLSAFSVNAVTKNGYIQLITVPDADKPDSEAGRVVGWAKFVDFQEQDLRNCS